MIDAGKPFTIPALAERLNVSPSSLYNHVTGRAEILEIIRDRLDVNLPHAEIGTDWERVIREWGRNYRARFAEHPNLVVLLTAQTIAAPKVLEQYEAVAEMLENAGFTLNDIQMIVTTLDNFLLGSALDLAAPNEVWSQQAAKPGVLARALAASPQGTARADQAFEFGLEMIIRGLRGRISGPRIEG